MSRYGKPLLAILFVLLVVEILVIAPKDVDLTGENEILLSDEQVGTNQVEQAMNGVEVVGTRDESKEWQLWADRAVDFKNTETWALEKVKAVFFTKDGGFFRVTGDRGVVEMETKNMRVQGNVVTKSSNGYIFKTQEVLYDSNQKILSSPETVMMQGPADAKGGALKLQGGQMTARMADSAMEVQGDVRAERNFHPDKRVVIRSQRALLSGKSNLAKFLGNVKIDANTMRITAPEAQFKYDRDKQTLSSVQVQGGVRVSDVDKWATSEQLNVQFEKEKFVFQGNPRVVQNNDELRGDEIIFYNGGKKVEVRKARARVDKDSLEKAN